MMTNHYFYFGLKNPLQGRGFVYQESPGIFPQSRGGSSNNKLEQVDIKEMRAKEKSAETPQWEKIGEKYGKLYKEISEKPKLEKLDLKHNEIGKVPRGGDKKLNLYNILTMVYADALRPGDPRVKTSVLALADLHNKGQPVDEIREDMMITIKDGHLRIFEKGNRWIEGDLLGVKTNSVPEEPKTKEQPAVAAKSAPAEVSHPEKSLKEVTDFLTLPVDSYSFTLRGHNYDIKHDDSGLYAIFQDGKFYGGSRELSKVPNMLKDAIAMRPPAPLKLEPIPNNRESKEPPALAMNQ